MLGARIAALRRCAGLSQAELAQRLRISPSAVGMYEQGRREPAGQMLVEISRVFGVTTDYLLTGKAAGEADAQITARTIEQTLARLDQTLGERPDRPFSRQELALILSALLTAP